MQKIRIGMIGYNFMGKAHSHAYRDVPFYFDLNVEPVLQTIVGRDEDRVSAAADKLGWLSYETDWRRVVEREDIDLIDIGTPNHLHSEIAIAALEAGKHVICEKPLALTLKQAKAMRDAARKSGSIHMICHNYRFAPAVQMAKRLIESGQLGEIYHYRANYLQDWLMDPQYPMSWRLNKEISGSGAHGDLMSHSIDLARFLLGEIAEVSGMMKTFIKRRPLDGTAPGDGEEPQYGIVDVDDASAFLATFENGAMGVFEATRFAKGNRNANRLEVNGSKGALRWDMENMNLLQVYLDEEKKNGLEGFRTINCTEEEHPYAGAYWPSGHIIGYEHTFVNLVYELLKGIETGRNPAPDFEDGYRNQAVLEAVEQSARTGRWVKLNV